ncbi:MAG: hypothetical protein CR986_00725 [Ignavibacteriae bacterium]|nr:MAG: hypothetical protein CR986_00725 [Ignavibacteriota bacterium]
MSLLEIFSLILIIIGIILGIILIFFILKLNKSVDVLMLNFNKMDEKLKPILENVKQITSKAVSVSSETEKRVMEISDTIQNVKNTVSKFTVSKNSNAGKTPVHDLLNNVRAVSKGVAAFWNKLTNS